MREGLRESTSVPNLTQKAEVDEGPGAHRGSDNGRLGRWQLGPPGTHTPCRTVTWEEGKYTNSWGQAPKCRPHGGRTQGPLPGSQPLPGVLPRLRGAQLPLERLPSACTPTACPQLHVHLPTSCPPPALSLPTASPQPALSLHTLSLPATSPQPAQLPSATPPPRGLEPLLWAAGRPGCGWGKKVDLRPLLGEQREKPPMCVGGLPYTQGDLHLEEGLRAERTASRAQVFGNWAQSPSHLRRRRGREAPSLQV